MINCLLLFHKCGNNYVTNVHRVDRSTKFIKSVKPDEARTLAKYDRKDGPINVRCRNFGLQDIQESGLLNFETARFLLFTRDPASFVLSAVNYHMRGTEKWATDIPQSHFNGKSLVEALKAEMEVEGRQIVIMKQFQWLYEKQVSFLECLSDSRFKRVRCEDIFTTSDSDYFSEIAEFLRIDSQASFVGKMLRQSNDPPFLYALKKASPAFKKNLPSHSTGSFKVNSPYHSLRGSAKEFFDERWLGFSRELGYVGS